MTLEHLAEYVLQHYVTLDAKTAWTDQLQKEKRQWFFEQLQRLHVETGMEISAIEKIIKDLYLKTGEKHSDKHMLGFAFTVPFFAEFITETIDRYKTINGTRPNTTVQFQEALQSVEEKDKLLQDLDDVIYKIVARIAINKPASEKQNLFYHFIPHAMEMAHDAELALAPHLDKLFPGDPAMQQVYSKMVAAAAAAHDIIQQQGPNNEKASKEIYDVVMKEVLAAHGLQGEAMEAFVEKLSQKVIVNGTIYNFMEGKPLVDGFNEVLGANGLPDPEGALLLASVVVGKNDTRRMEFANGEYFKDADSRRLLQEQVVNVGGVDNAFVEFACKKLGITKFKLSDIQENPSPEIQKLLAFIHCAGQNMRMGAVELTSGFGKESTRMFSVVYGKFLEQVRAAGIHERAKAQALLPKIIEAELQRRGEASDPEAVNKKLTEFYEQMRTIVVDPNVPFLGEARFSAKMTSEKMTQAIEAYNSSLPVGSKLIIENPEKVQGSFWQEYAKVLEAYHAEKMPAGAKPEQQLAVLTDFALLGAQQMGHSLAQQEGRVQQYMQELQAEMQSIFNFTDSSPVRKILEDAVVKHRQLAELKGGEGVNPDVLRKAEKHFEKAQGLVEKLVLPKIDKDAFAKIGEKYPELAIKKGMDKATAAMKMIDITDRLQTSQNYGKVLAASPQAPSLSGQQAMQKRWQQAVAAAGQKSEPVTPQAPPAPVIKGTGRH